MSDLSERLRAAAKAVRSKPMPLSDFIPLLQQAADALDAASAADDGGLHVAYLKGRSDEKEAARRRAETLRQ